MSNPQSDKLILYSGFNSFKNSDKYSGSISFPTSVAAGAVGTKTSVFALDDPPVYTEFFSYFKLVSDTIFSTGNSNWYGEAVSGAANVGVHVSAPSANAGWIGASLYPVIDGTTVTITAEVVNPYGSTITIDALSVDFVFIDYTLAN